MSGVLQQLQIELCPCEIVDALTEILESAEAVSITLTDSFDDPILEPPLDTTPLWPSVNISALFDQEAGARDMQASIGRNFPQLRVSITEVADENWIQAYKDSCKPLSFGKRLMICPSWSTPPQSSIHTVILDPGLAFGTGTHPSTELCLRWLDKTDLDNKTLIDYGAGSGILALAALKLQASSVYAVDIDPQALRAIQSNAEINQIREEQLLIDYPEALISLKEPVDILMANILLNPLLELKTKFHRLLKAQGILLLSGILNEQADSLIDAYQDLFQLKESQSKDGWSLLVFRS